MNALPETTIDESNPWLGLASFTEETRSFFHGRDAEVAELARRVQRKLLTVLFGQSGLGKTSILRAGLVPRLRAEGYCPVYVRIDYGKEAPEPAEQIKQAIARTARRSGEWTQVGVAVEGESLWEFLHHRDDVLQDESGTTLTPLLIFDQFEEIFTLAQSDDFGRARAARFIDELADLVENRPPKAFEAKLDLDDSAAERFDFARSDYRVLIALREDYLAPLEGLKKVMPSISQNRLRLAPMTGTQALAAVLLPGKGLVTEEVAAAIVRFVAGGAELANAEVEPSLLSLICRELNDARIAQGRNEISLDLLAGSHATILSNFYERALADQPAAVRRIVEDHLLTESGFRENVAEENLLRRFAAAGAAPDTLATLVNRRLLRIEERLDIRRVELTHDVLCGVVKSSRDQRQEREAREATERLLADQQARELSARRALVRARQIAIACTLLAAVALVAAAFALFNVQRARRAEREAQQTRAVAEQARGQAEHLLGYLADDFARELESFGRLNVVAEFTQRQIDYFRALPAALKGPETTRNGALALIHHARALRVLGDLDGGSTNATEAIKLLEQQRAGGDHSEATTIALAQGYLVQSMILGNRNDPTASGFAIRGADLVKPLAEAPNASFAARSAYVELCVRMGFNELDGNHLDEAIRLERQAMQTAVELGARDLTNLDMGALYTEGGAWLVNALVLAGRNDEARRAALEAIELADRVLEQRPGSRLTLHGKQVIESVLVNVAQNDLNPLEALQFSKRSEQTALTLLNLDPRNVVTANNLGIAYQATGDTLWASGRLREAMPSYAQALDAFSQATTGGTGFFMIRAYTTAVVAVRQTQLGDLAGAERTTAEGVPFLARLREIEPVGGFADVLAKGAGRIALAEVARQHDDLESAQRVADEVTQATQATSPKGAFQATQKNNCLFYAANIAGHIAYLRGRFAEAEKAERISMDTRRALGDEAIPDKRDLGEIATWLAMALVREGRTAEAAKIIAPYVKIQRELAAKNHGDQWLPLELASALYAEALADPKQRDALLREAGTLVAGLPPTLRALHDVRLWSTRIQEARNGT